MKKPVVPPLTGRRSLKTRTPVGIALDAPILRAPSPVVENCDATTSLMTTSAPGGTLTPFTADGTERPPGELAKYSNVSVAGVVPVLTARTSATNLVLLTPSACPTTGK